MTYINNKVYLVVEQLQKYLFVYVCQRLLIALILFGKWGISHLGHFYSV